MIKNIQLVRNIGQFDSVTDGASIDLHRLTLVYGENGRGKTTLSAILRSLATGSPNPIAERRRLGGVDDPHVVLHCDGALPSSTVFENNVWNTAPPNMAVFDETFVDQNVHSGLGVGPGQRQQLHEWILGTQGVELTRQLQEVIAAIEVNNTSLRTKQSAIPQTVLASFSVDEFCALPSKPDINEAIQEAERRLAAAQAQDLVRTTPQFERLGLPVINLTDIERILQQDLPALESSTVALLQSHFEGLGNNGESWVAIGMGYLPDSNIGDEPATCPFCAQGIVGSPVIVHYRSYFSQAYEELKQNVHGMQERLNQLHGGEMPATFERTVRLTAERVQYWSQFTEVPEIGLDTEQITQAWTTAREAISALLTVKQGAPLEKVAIPEEAKAAATTFQTHCEEIDGLNTGLQTANRRIQTVKEEAISADVSALTSELALLRATNARHSPEYGALCDDYLAEKASKANNEIIRDQTKQNLEIYRNRVFPEYEVGINAYLRKFNAGFELNQVVSVDTRGGPACNYSLVIRGVDVPVGGGTPAPDEPSFKNTLSSGDRNTLALAFFFASLDQEPDISEKIVVIDDPNSSMDEHRSLTTVEEVISLVGRVRQVILLSHSKQFLCETWEGSDSSSLSALSVFRAGDGSSFRSWDVNQDSITEYDRRHELLRSYLSEQTADNRPVAEAIRPVLEGFSRVAYPEHFPPGTLLGNFLDRCRQKSGTPEEILNTTDFQELENLRGYGNKFHHDTNRNWRMETINDGELSGFVGRTIAFAKR